MRPPVLKFVRMGLLPCSIGQAGPLKASADKKVPDPHLTEEIGACTDPDFQRCRRRRRTRATATASRRLGRRRDGATFPTTSSAWFDAGSPPRATACASAPGAARRPSSHTLAVWT